MRYRVEPPSFEIDFKWREENDGIYVADWGYGNAISRVDKWVFKDGDKWVAMYGHNDLAYYDKLDLAQKRVEMALAEEWLRQHVRIVSL